MNNVVLSKIIGNEGIFIDGDWVESKDQDPNGSVRLIQLADIGDGKFINKSNRYLTSEKAQELRCTYLKEGDVLVARMPDPLGRACLFPKLNTPCVTVVDVCIVRPDKKLASPEWLMFLINSPFFRNKIARYITGTTRQRISRGNLEKIEFELPSIERQQQIVNILTQANELRRKRKQATDLLDEYIKSVFIEMFGDPVSNPKGWKKLTATEYSRLVTVGVVIKPASYYKDNGVVALRSLNIRANAINLKTVVYFSPEDNVGKLSKSRLNLGDVVVVRTGSTGTAAVIPEELAGINCIDLIIVRPMSDIINPYYLCFLLNSDRGKHLISMKEVGGIQKHFNIGALKQLSIPIPPIEEQNKFASLLHNTEDVKKKMFEQSTELENQFQTLIQQAFKTNNYVSQIIS